MIDLQRLCAELRSRVICLCIDLVSDHTADDHVRAQAAKQNDARCQNLLPRRRDSNHSVRANGQSLGAGTHWVFAAVITLVMPFFLNRFEPTGIFSFFAGLMVLQLLFVLFMMPETKGRSLEDLGKDVYEHHLE